MKKLLAVLLVALTLVACGNKSVTTKGSFQSEADEQGNYTTAEVTLVDGKITEVVIDEYYALEDTTKKTLGANYGMIVGSSIGKEWNEQVQALENWCVGKTGEEVFIGPATEELKSSCTIYYGHLLQAVAAACDAAK